MSGLFFSVNIVQYHDMTTFISHFFNIKNEKFLEKYLRTLLVFPRAFLKYLPFKPFFVEVFTHHHPCLFSSDSTANRSNSSPPSCFGNSLELYFSSFLTHLLPASQNPEYFACSEGILVGINFISDTFGN